MIYTNILPITYFHLYFFKNALSFTNYFQQSSYLILGQENFHLNMYWVRFSIVFALVFHRVSFIIEFSFWSRFVFDWAWFSKPTATRHSVCLRPGWNTCPCKWPWASLLSGQAPAMQCCFPHLHRENLPQLNFPQM